MPFGKFGWPYLDKAGAITRTVLPVLTCVWYFHVLRQWDGCQHLGFFLNVRADVDECNCTWWLYWLRKSLHWKLTLGGKSLPTLGTQAHISSRFDFSAWHSTNWDVAWKCLLCVGFEMVDHRCLQCLCVHAVCICLYANYNLQKKGLICNTAKHCH